MTDQIHTITMSEEEQRAFASGWNMAIKAGIKKATESGTLFVEELRDLSMPAPTQGWTVRPLEWEEPCDRNNWVHVAKTAFGEYYVSIDGGSHTAWLEAHIKPYENLLGPAVGSVYEAKDQAQADYARRISAAILPQPPEGV